jgi:integrase
MWPRLIEAAVKVNPSLPAYFRLAAATGARRGELCALRWKHIDLEKHRVTIARSMAEVGRRAHREGHQDPSGPEGHNRRGNGGAAPGAPRGVREPGSEVRRVDRAGLVPVLARGRLLEAMASELLDPRLRPPPRRARPRRREAAPPPPLQRHAAPIGRHRHPHRQRPSRPRQRVNDTRLLRSVPPGRRRARRRCAWCSAQLRQQPVVPALTAARRQAES